MKIQDFSTFIKENEKRELKELCHSLFEELVCEYSEEYEIDEGILTKLRDAISGWFEQNIKGPLGKPKEFINNIKNNIQSIKSDIQEDIDLIKSKLRPRNKKQIEVVKDKIRDTYYYGDLPKQYQEELDDYIDNNF
ncbi:hypothetical protein [uncultured Methanobrevibacter sp.]|uniref:hypothetical protein n=1 Tax=uncultured Methanobrevibacter sp. TaxID=253161 RepID=UPI0025CF144A|nr:hypothetical protein [uncultured Methanobrevibacter sp.]